MSVQLMSADTLVEQLCVSVTQVRDNLLHWMLKQTNKKKIG